MIDVKPINDEASHEAALARVERLMGAELGTPEGNTLDILTTLIYDYEEKQMNTEQQCRILCKAHKINPDMEAPAIWQRTPGLRQNGKVRAWHMYVAQVERSPQTQDKEEEQRKANLQRIIDESIPGSKTDKKFSCYDDNAE